METNVMGRVYIVKFNPPYKDVFGYIGWSKSLARRLGHHRRGTGSRLCAAAVRAGCQIELIYDAPGTRADERKLKRYKNCRKLVASLEKKGMLNHQRPAKKKAKKSQLPAPYILGDDTP